VKERTAFDDVQDFLHPIPNAPSARDGHPFGNAGYVTVVSEPLRWLRADLPTISHRARV
jgi:hypothetical protein